MTVRVRFAPSPTGQVHIGNIRAAIFNWLFARHTGGKFLLRIEDTDRERSTPEAVRAVLDAMDWLGLNTDEEPLYQSARLKAHQEAAARLLAGGQAYREDKGGTGQGACIVFRMPGTDMTFQDEIKGQLTKEAAHLKDFVILRSDGSPVFHLANVVDDIAMGITHVIRGDDHIENTYRHVALFRALGAPPPKYAHLPMIVNAQGKPYSKRDGAAFVGEFREKGFCAEAFFNYLALLGWSPGDDREKMTRAEMIDAFTLERVKSGPAQMDLRKLTHLNWQYLSALPADEFGRRAREFVARYDWAGGLDDGYFLKVAALLQSRTGIYSQAADWKHFFMDEIEYDMKAVRDAFKRENARPALELARQNLARVEFSLPALRQAVQDTEAAAGLSAGKLNQPLRVAVTGTAVGAGIFETLELLGKEKALARLDRALNSLLPSQV